MDCCTIPYATDIRRASGLPVYSMHNFATRFQALLGADTLSTKPPIRRRVGP